MPPVIEKIDLGTVLPGCKRVQNGNLSEVWKGWINTHKGIKSAYIKLIPSNQLVSEIVCALLGRSLNLNIPKPYLVIVNKQELPDSAIWNINAVETAYGFASEDLQKHSFLHWANRDAKIKQRLLAWDGYRPSGVFDEWIANRDRNQGNLLYQGRGVWWLIDHGQAFTGPDWTAKDLAHDAQVANLLIDFAIKVDPSLDERHRWRDIGNAEIVKYCDLPLHLLKECAILDEYASSQAQVQAILDFVEKRISVLMPLLCKRLGIGMLPI